MSTQGPCLKRRRSLPFRSLRHVFVLIFGIVCLFQADFIFAADSVARQSQIKPIPYDQIATFFFLMLGPIKVIGPFARITQGADREFARSLAYRAILISILALLLAAFIGESILAKYDIPLSVLALAGGLILFLVALQSILRQFTPPRSEGRPVTPDLKMAVSPIAFPTIVTPYGTAALIIFIALSPDIRGRAIIFAILLGIMLLNLIAMILARYILRFLGVFLQILGAVLGIIQVTLGLKIIINSVRLTWT